MMYKNQTEKGTIKFVTTYAAKTSTNNCANLKTNLLVYQKSQSFVYLICFCTKSF